MTIASLKIAVEAWFDSQNRKFYFQGINSWKKSTKIALMLQENMSEMAICVICVNFL